jgi:hypothetical protein
VADRLGEFAASGVDVLMVNLLAMDQPTRLQQLEALPALVR